jgi:hypothetical protein
MALRMDIWKYAAALTLACGLAGSAHGQVLFAEDFNDEIVDPATHLQQFVIGGGFVTFDDMSGGERGRMTRVQDFTAIPVMTFSWDMVPPVVARYEPASFEVVFRAGIGTGTNSLQSGDFIMEAILWRDGPRSNFQNNGNETAFVVANNKDTPEMFTSPVDSMPFTLDPFTYITYLQDRTTQAFTVFKAMTGYSDRNGADPGFGDIARFSIGTSSSGHQGTFGMDGVLVNQGVTFDRGLPEQGTPGDVDGDDDVDMDDFAIIQSHFQQAVTMRSEGDLTFDNFVDFRDFRQWKNNAPAPVLGQLAAIPEPSAVLLAGLAIAGLAAVRRRR